MKSIYLKDFNTILRPELHSIALFNNDLGYASIGFKLTLPTGSTAAFEGSFDGDNFVDVRMRNVDRDEYTNRSSTSDNFLGSISNLRFFRVRITTAGSGDGSVKGRVSTEASTLEGIEQGYRPDSIGNRIFHKDFEITTAVIGTAIWTPESGRKFVITDLAMTVDGQNTVTIFDQTDVAGNRLFKGRYTGSNNTIPINLITPFVSAAADNVLKITTENAGDVRGTLHGYEIT